MQTRNKKLPQNGNIIILPKAGPFTGEKICSAGQFGWDCQLTCHCAGSDQCDTNNGDCPGDCAEGWMGPKCQLQAGEKHLLVLRFRTDRNEQSV